MADIDDKLQAALKQAKKTPMNFAFVGKSSSQGKLVVSKRPIAATDVAAAKKELGGGIVFRGRCVGEEGKLVFETAKEPPLTLGKQLKTVIKEKAGLILNIETRVAPDLVEDGGADASPPTDDGQAPAPTAATPVAAPSGEPQAGADAKADVTKRLAALAGPIKEAVAGKGPDVEKMHALMTSLKDLLGKKNYPGAAKVLDELEPLVANAQAPAAPPVTGSLAGGRPGGSVVAAPPTGGAGAAAEPAAPPGTGVQGGAAGPSGPMAGTPPEKVKYDTERAAVVKLRTDLGNHQQAAHVTKETGEADTALAKADSEAAKPDWKKAMAELAKARKACADGKGFADKFADYLTKRAEASLVLTAAQNSWSGWSGLTAYPPFLTSAKTKAAARNYTGAKADLDKISTGLGPMFKKVYVDDLKPKIKTLKALPEAKFIAPEIAAIDKMMAEQEIHIAAQQWRQVGLTGTMLDERITAANKIGTRRKAFDTERPKADAALKTLQAHGAAVAAPLAQIRQRLKEADELASKSGEKSMQFEDAKNQVLAIIKDCAIFDHLARGAAPYTKERGALAGELTALRAHAAAGKIKAELDVVGGLLDAAAKAAGDTGVPGTALALSVDPSKHDIGTANARLKQARADLADAGSLAKGLDGVATVENAVKGSVNLTDLRKGEEALAKELAAAHKAKHADLAKAEFDAVKAALDDVKKKIDAKQADPAAQALKTAGEKLTAGRRIQIEHERFVERHAALTKKLDKLNADKSQAKIKAKIDALAKGLADASAAETSKDYAKAMATLDAAEAAAGAADAALTARAAFDKEANLVQLDLDQPAYASIKVAQTAELTKARDLADAFDFVGADTALKAIRNRISAAEANAMANKTPPDPKLAEKATKLAQAGGAAELDDLIKNLPNTVDKKVFIQLAQARFPGVTFELDADGNEQASVKRICALMKDLPDDVVNKNPSLKKILRRPTESGTFYRGSENLVVTKQTPGAWINPNFKKGATPLLPAREPDCEPANENPEDMFDFNMLHELAHSIDDAKNYMGQNGGNPDHGGWIEHGGDVNSIVEAVITATGYGTKAEERQYVTDRILRNPVVAPAGLTGDAKAKFDKFETFANAALKPNVWDSQSDSTNAKLGDRIYHEAYPTTWVSYLADARRRGITGYQFRAPGEWFAELYAAWKVGKLQPSHPALKWLTKLKV